MCFSVERTSASSSVHFGFGNNNFYFVKCTLDRYIRRHKDTFYFNFTFIYWSPRPTSEMEKVILVAFAITLMAFSTQGKLTRVAVKLNWFTFTCFRSTGWSFIFSWGHTWWCPGLKGIRFDDSRSSDQIGRWSNCNYSWWEWFTKPIARTCFTSLHFRTQIRITIKWKWRSKFR